MKKYSVLYTLVLSILFLVSGCTNGGVQNQPLETDSVATPELPYLTQDGYLKPCELISVEEWQNLFEEAPLFVEEVNGGCLVSNQWETRSIFMGVYPQSQAYPAMRWFTQSLEAESNNPEFLFQMRELLANQTNEDIRSLIDERIKLYEALLYRTERIFVIGDYAIWFSYHESSTNILEVLQEEQYIRINLAGFYPVEARKLALDVGELVVERLPQKFEILFNLDSDLLPSEETSPSLVVNTPVLTSITANPEEIFFGSLCTGETAQLEITLTNQELINNVFLVYRLTSQKETNQNWTTIFMSPSEAGTWVKTLNAETDFSSYTLTHDAEVEVYIGVLYELEKVINSPVYKMITVKQCGAETPTAATQTP